MPAKLKLLAIIAGFATLFGTALFVVSLLREKLSLLDILLIALVVLGIVWAILSKKGRLPLHIKHVVSPVNAASKTDFFIDLFHIIGLVSLVFLVCRVISSGDLLSPLEKLVFGLAIAAVLFHEWGYPVLRYIWKGQTKWDKDYRHRKVMLASAVTYMTTCMRSGSYSIDRIKNIEITILRAIKMVIEFHVLDRDGNNINISILVRHPNDESQLVCVQRATPGRKVPTFYSMDDIPHAQAVFRNCDPLYISNFSHPEKNYKMIWLLPILSDFDNTTCIGVLSVDSLRSGHLDLLDERNYLSLLISPYISVLRYTLTARSKFGIWDDLREEHPRGEDD